MASQDHTSQTLKKLRAQGKLTGTVDDATARELLKTPPSSLTTLHGGPSSSGATTAGQRGHGAASPSLINFSLDDNTSNTSRANSRLQHQQHGPHGPTDFSIGSPISAQPPADDFYAAGAGVERPVAKLIIQLERDCEAFHSTLAENTQLTKDHLQRSLLQLFEETVRDKLPDTIGRKKGNTDFNSRTTLGGGGAAAGGVAGIRQMHQSRRHIDRGLDRRDTASEVVIPDDVRRAIGKDISHVVDHELKRVLGAIGTDIMGIMGLVTQLRSKVGKVEEDVMQREVEATMLADQVTSLTTQCDTLRVRCSELDTMNGSKDRQDDVLREQIARRNKALDETRVAFRKEQARYKSRIYELEQEVDVLRAGGRNKSGGGSGGGQVVDKKLIMTSVGPLEDDDLSNEISAATEMALREATAQFQEEMRKVEVLHCREKKALAQEMHLKLQEREMEIVRLKEKLRGSSPMGEE